MWILHIVNIFKFHHGLWDGCRISKFNDDVLAWGSLMQWQTCGFTFRWIWALLHTCRCANYLTSTWLVFFTCKAEITLLASRIWWLLSTTSILDSDRSSPCPLWWYYLERSNVSRVERISIGTLNNMSEFLMSNHI